MTFFFINKRLLLINSHGDMLDDMKFIVMILEDMYLKK